MAKATKTNEPALKAPRKSSKKQPEQVAQNGTHYSEDSLPFTPTEEVPHEEPKQTAVAVLSAEQQAEREVARFDKPRAWIAEKKEAYQDLAIAGVEDKEGYKAVKEAWQEIRNKRLAVQNKHKEIKSDYLVIIRAVDKEKNDLCELLAEVEDPLKAEMDRIDKIKEEEKQRAEKEAEERLHKRVSELLGNGMKFDGSYYAIGETISMDVVTIKQMNDEQYAGFLQTVQNKNQEIIDAENKRKEEEAAEKKRVEDQKAENDRKEKELEQERENMRKEKHEARAERLVDLGYVLNGSSWVYTVGKHSDVFQATTIAFADMSYEEWAAFLESKKQKVNDFASQDKQDQKVAAQEEQRKQRIADREREIGQRFQIFRHNDQYLIRNGEYDTIPQLSVPFEIMGSYTAEAWNEYTETLAQSYKETLSLESAEKERLKNIEEAERQAALSDSERIYEWLQSFAEWMAKSPTIESPEVKKHWDIFDTTVADAIDRFTTKLEELK